MEAVAEKPVEQKRRSIQINADRVQLAEYQRNDWVANAPEGATPEDLKDPQFWSIMAFQFKPYDRIEVRADDGTWLAECLVKQAERNYAIVAVLVVHHLDAAPAKDVGSEFDIVFKGPQNKWCVIRESDKEVIKKELPTRDAAQTWLADYKKAV